MPDIPEEVIQEAVRAHQCAWVSGVTSHEALVRIVLEAALPRLQSARKPRITCPVCGKEVVRRDDGKPTSHYAKDHDPQFTCDGTMYSRCRGGCKCKKHR